MLFSISKYIHREKMVSTVQLARAFQLAQDALVPMLLLLEKKGMILAHTPQSGCQKKCGQCVTGLVYYSAVDSK